MGRLYQRRPICRFEFYRDGRRQRMTSESTDEAVARRMLKEHEARRGVGVHYFAAARGPVMPVATIGFMLKPVGFFDRNPALDVPRPTPHGACCEPG